LEIAVRLVFAYLDPSTGSLVLQVVVGGFLTTMAAVKIYWKKLKGVFVKGSPKHD
jgi:hypothetical protein